MEKDLTKGKVWKTLLLFAFPIMGANLLQSMYGTVDLMIVGLFTNKCEVSAVSTGSMMGYLNDYGETVFVALQGILSTFLVRIPVSCFMSKIPCVSLFQVGLATPMATLFAIVLCTRYLIYFEKKRKRKGNIADI